MLGMRHMEDYASAHTEGREERAEGAIDEWAKKMATTRYLNAQLPHRTYIEMKKLTC